MEKVYKGKSLDGEWGKVSSLEGQHAQSHNSLEEHGVKLFMARGQCVF